MSQKTAYTPGPWHACVGDDNPELCNRGKRVYFPHVHIGADASEHFKTYESSDGSTQKIRPHTITINEAGEQKGRQGPGPAGLAEFDANARLIAAAPVMYETLAMLDDFVRLMVKDENADGYAKALALMKQHEGETFGKAVRAVLAQVRGGK